MTSQPLPDGEANAPVSVTRLLAEVAGRSGILWIEVPGAGEAASSTHPAWFVWHDDGDPRGTGPAAYIVSGPGEQTLPWLPPEVTLLFRSKDSRGRLLRVGATTSEVRPEDARWDACVEILRPERLNAAPGVPERWRASATIHVLAPHGRLVEGPGAYAAESHRAPLVPAPATTATWRPWHWKGRPRERKGTPRA